MTLDSAADYAAALTELRVRAGLTVRDVSRRTGIPPATLGGYFSGRHLPQVTQKHVLSTLLRALGVPDHEIEDWHEDLLRVRRVPGPRARRVTPYRGLESFGVADADWFFGREQVATDLVARVDALLGDTSTTRLLTVVGSSGSGKSSLLRAGLAARLEGVPHAVCVPGAAPLAALTAALDALPEGPGLVVVDQFEELFHDRVTPEDRAHFLERLAALVTDPDSADRVAAVALRADFYGHAVAEPLLLPLLDRHQVLVGAMDHDGVRRAVVEPALRAGRPVDPQLVDLILRDLTPRSPDGVEPNTLPLLSHALLATWNQARGGQLTVNDYLAVGGLAGAVQQTAEEIYLSQDARLRHTTRRLFAQLVDVEEDGLARRRRCEHAELVDDEHMDQVVEAFVARRILTATEHTLEISHEVLLDAWPRLRAWLAEDHDDHRIRRRISLAAREWDAHGREPGGLMRGVLLQLATRFRDAGSTRVALAGLERDYLEASLAEQARIERRERRHVRRLLNLLVAVGVLALVTTFMSAYLVKANREADRQRAVAEHARREALSRQVAIQANQLAEAAPALSAQLALAAHEIAPTVEARSALLDATGRRRATRLLGPEGPMGVVPSPDGAYFAVVSADGKVRFWQYQDGAPPVVVATVPAGTGGELYAGAYSPDGRTFAAGGSEGGLTVFDVSDPAHPVAWDEQPTGPESAIQALEFSPDGTVLAAAASDPGLFRWSMGPGEATPLRVTKDFTGSVQGVAFGSGGLVATASTDAKVRLFEPRGPRLRLVRELAVGPETNYVWSVAFSPDGRLLAATSKDKKVRVWNVARPAEPRLVTRLGGFESWVNSTAFSPDGATLTAVASGGLLQSWSTADWSLVGQAQGPSNFTTLAYSPSGDTMLTGSIDGTAGIWATRAPHVAGLGDNIWGISYPSDGDRLYVGVGSTAPGTLTYDTSVRGELVQLGDRLTGPATAGVTDGVVAVSPDGDLLVAGTAAGELALWRATAGDGWRPAGVLEAATQLIESAVFSPDGHYLASTADDGAVAVYDVSGDGRPTEVARLDAKGIAFGATFNRDGSLLAVTTANKDVRLWRRTADGYAGVDRVAPFDNYVYSVAFNADGSLLAAGSTDKTVRFFAVSDSGLREVGAPVHGPQDTIINLSWRADGLLAGAVQDGTIWMWKVGDEGSAELWAKLRGLGADVLAVLHHPTRAEVAAGGSDGTVGVWSTDVDAAADQVCAVSGSRITEEEWELYVPGAPYDAPC